MLGQVLSSIVFGTFPRLSTRPNFSFVDVAGVQSDFAFSVCLGILEFSKVETSEMVALGSTFLVALAVAALSISIESMPVPSVAEREEEATLTCDRKNLQYPILLQVSGNSLEGRRRETGTR